MIHTVFSYSKFMALSGSDLIEYAVWVLDDAGVEVDDCDLKTMLAELGTYDPDHTVCAVEIGCRRRPSLFIGRAACLLNHLEQSVRLCANRVLEHAPPDVITEELLVAVERGLVNCPEREHFTPTLHLLRERMNTG